MGDSAGIQERCMQDGDENLKPHLCTVNYTVAEQGLAQYSRTSASPKRQFGCAHLVLERLITRTWPGCASWLPDLGMKFPAKKGSQKARIAAHLHHGAAAPSYSGLPAHHSVPHSDCTVVGVGGAVGFFGGAGIKDQCPKLQFNGRFMAKSAALHIFSRSGRGLVLGGHVVKSVG